MKLETRLPRNGKEGALYGGIICTLTVLLMTTLSIILISEKLDGNVVLLILKTLPIMWIIAMIMEPVIIGPIAEKLVGKFTEPADSFNAKILFRILFTVLGMSACMTLIGDIVGNGISSEIFSRFLTNWPRNFLIVLIAESLVIQPIARFAMVKLHAYQDKKNYASMMTK
ncbi:MULTISPECIES: DUF2798 domain-containing protein [unclassified Peribacillus]|uniref:DUF2798 domain-containing protein n=1 Tax=unclassified Peribacillus TaxID=2675266 RepID=UPI001911DBBA|nr:MULTISPECIES: DUF2798 domain-containing protein [unclassified Peribacillus]MBK5443775.1 DUF2798 domain-containing protein [Peribacillus sp. TH24]MBK5461506.1 DUF2798 domain-containing protein [Peribacillus sp. TH27]